MLKTLLFFSCCFFSMIASAKEADMLKIIEVPFYKNLTIDLPINAELSSWDSGGYFWYIQNLKLTA